MFKPLAIFSHKLFGADDSRIRKMAGAVSERLIRLISKSFSP
jgi:hypothetical protein